MPAPTITTESMRRDATVPRVHALLAAATLLFGHSAEHRPLTATRVGSGPVKVLVVGSIHGNETAGRAVLRRLRRAQPPAGVELWLVDSVNPDGVRRGTRQNAHGVDLNRNFAPPLARRRASVRHLLPRPARVLRARVAGGAAARPADPARGHRLLPPAHAAGEPLVRRRSGGRARLRAPRRPPGAHAAELPRHRHELAEPHVPGHERVRGRAAGRAALAGVGAPPRRRGARGGRRQAATAAAVSRPPIVWRKIPFGATRRAQMRALRPPPLRHRQRRAARPEGDRRALHRVGHVQLRLQHVRGQRARRRAARAARRLRPFRHRSRRHDLPAGVIAAHVPPHRRAQRPLHRHRARRLQRRRDPRPPGAAARVAAPHALAPGALRDPPARRHRPRREPVEPLPPRARRRLRTQTHGDFARAAMRRYRGKL